MLLWPAQPAPARWRSQRMGSMCWRSNLHMAVLLGVLRPPARCPCSGAALVQCCSHCQPRMGLTVYLALEVPRLLMPPGCATAAACPAFWHGDAHP